MPGSVPSGGAFNPGAIRLPDGKIMLYVRVAEGFDFHDKVLKFPRIVSKDYGIEVEEIPKKKIGTIRRKPLLKVF